ncbi:homing endonuclease associated repeat-containing protein [Halosimplex pelagicum]|uniref:Uncharacterized protein n=1 Tax=Halosimplex pelagicum TaxID=869886 RepID=A0A7D5TTC0_9EURY|nr:hypothetical protein [Halosimplex pelagicum]QLH81254.1 hypothetical protein HZS54_06205 [Halosimplex pelagicum]
MPYSDTDLLSEIERLADELGHPPSLTEVREHGQYSVTTYYDRFGSWQDAVEAAGYDPQAPTTEIPESELLAELRELAEEFGEPPSAAQMDADGEYWASTYRDRFGSWNEAIEAAGLEPTDEPSQIPDSDLLAEINRLADDLGDPPTFQEMDEQGEYAARVYVSHFGSWNAAIEAAGFEPTQRGSSLSESELLFELQRLADELEKQPSAREMDADGKFGSATYQRQFGSWSAALEAAFEN